MEVAMYQTIKVVPSGKALGAEVQGIDLSKPLNAQTRDELIDAWHQHLVIVIRSQSLSDAQLVAFGEYFGEVMSDPRPVDYEPALDTDIPSLVDVVSNVKKNGKPIGALGDGEAIWHTDTEPVPNGALILHALEIPSQGGNTRFGNMYDAYETLPASLKQQVDGKASIHDRVYGLVKDTLFHSSVKEPVERSRMPGPWWPIVRTHGATKRKSLYLQSQSGGHIVGLPSDESQAVLKALWDHMTQPQFLWEHEWRLGDVVVWDNRCTIHSRGSFSSSERRRLHRITIRGEWPH